jgi:hypothetical protein
VLVGDGFEDIIALRADFRETEILASTIEEDSFCGIGNGITVESVRIGVWWSICILTGGRH